MNVEFRTEAPPVDVVASEPDELPPPEPRPPIRRRFLPRTLTGRIVAGVVAVVVVVVIGIGGGTYYTLRSFLYNRLDQQVAPVAGFNATRLQQCFADGQQSCGLYGPGNYRATQTEWLVVLDSTGRSVVPVASDNGLKAMRLSASDSKSLVSTRPAARTVTTTDNQQLRVSTRQVAFNGDSYLVVSGLSTNDLTTTLSRLVAAELIIGLSAVIVALGATTWGVQFSLRRLRRVTVTAQEVSAELSPEGAGLDRRVPEHDSGTEVGQLAESFNTMLAAVETQFAARLASERRMRQFLADASHELRTPLTSIRGYAELARMQRAAGITDEAAGEDNLGRIESEGTRMSRLVEDLLMLARGDADERAHQHEPVDLAGVLDDVVSSSRAAFADRPIDVEMAPAPTVLGDRDQLVRLVRNLVTNAAVHTAQGRPILVREFAASGGAMITVADGGPGLPPDQAEHVFERFWRADKARTRARGGSGLGMSIVASIVRAHGGTVRFDSAVETGSTVTVWLPAAPGLPSDQSISR